MFHIWLSIFFRKNQNTVAIGNSTSAQGDSSTALGYNAIVNQIVSSSIANTMGLSVLTFSNIFGLVITVYLLLGIGIGVLGSSISMKKYLEV